MRVTLQQIAEKAGVSRGTVDRALNNRGRINPEVAERIRKLAAEMGYERNLAARALAMSQNSIRIGVIVQAVDTPNIKAALEGIEEAREEFESFGAEIIVRKIRRQDPDQVIEEMQYLREQKCGGIALMPYDDSRVENLVNQFANERIPVITFNTDLPGSRRICFVGQDAVQSGRTAGEIMAEILPQEAAVLMISGYPYSNSHRQRIHGFQEELQKQRIDLKFPQVRYDYDDPEVARSITLTMLEKYPDIRGIYIAAHGAVGVCRALEEMNLLDQVKVVANDVTEENIELLKERKVRFLIGQDSHTQGYEPVSLLFHLLVDHDKPKQECLYTELTVKVRNNL